MEENNNVTNLGGNIGNIQQPVYTPIQPTMVQPQVEPVPPSMFNQPIQPTMVQPPVNNMNTGVQTVTNVGSVQPQQPMNVIPNVVQPQQPVQEPQQTVKPQPQQIVDNKQKEPIIANNYIINTKDFQKVLNDLDLITTESSGFQLTEILQLVFDNEGLTVKATDAKNYLKKTITSVKYKEEMTIGIYLKDIYQLVGKIQTEYIELLPDYSTRTVVIKAGDDMFHIGEAYDTTNGGNIVIEDPFYDDKLPKTKIDFDNFRNKITSAGVCAASVSVQSSLSGVYCSKVIASTDAFLMYCAPNVPELVNETFYLDASFVSILSKLHVDGEVAIVLAKDESTHGVTSVSIVSDDTVFSGPVNLDIESFPISAVDNLSTQELQNSCSIDPNRVYNALDIIKLTVDPTGSDKGLGNFKFDKSNNRILLTDLGEKSKQYLSITDVVNSTDLEFKLNVIKLHSLFKDIKGDKITIYLTDPTDEVAYIKILNEDKVIIVTMQDME